MNSTTEYLNSPLKWENKKKKALLKQSDKIILELKAGKKKRAAFKFQDKIYSIRNKGFWNPITVVEENESVIMTLKRFFRATKAYIEFANGQHFPCKTHNAVFVKLSVFTGDKQEIIRYRLISKYKASMQLKVHSDVPEAEFILLIVFGFFVFSEIVKENNYTEMKSVIFSRSTPLQEIPHSEPA